MLLELLKLLKWFGISRNFKFIEIKNKLIRKFLFFYENNQKNYLIFKESFFFCIFFDSKVNQTNICSFKLFVLYI